MKLIDRLIESLASGEVFAVILAGIGGWGWAAIRGKADRAKQREIELGRLQFRLESQQAIREAVKEGMSEIKLHIQDLKAWLEKVDTQSEEALRMAQTLKATQDQCQKNQDYLKAIFEKKHE